MGGVGPEDQESRGLGAFRVLRRLPASSREVLLAKDADGKQVVLKVFDAPERNQGLFDDKVADEASAYGRLSHPNIVKVVDIFSADGKFVIALEWVDGSSLAVVRAMLERDAKKVPDECWLYVMHCVFAALAEAHAGKGADGKPAPVLHRGVNPSNVLIAWDGQVKLGNFNVAQSVRVLRDSNPGLTWGSYGYFAPEQVKLQPTTTATDVYSAALMLYELLAGKKALSRGEMTDTDLLKAMAAPSFVPLEQLRRDVSAPVRYAVRAGLEPDPKRRIASAVRIRDVLRAAIDVDGARKKLVEVLASIREHEAATVAPPALDLDEPFATRAPPPMELDEPASVELISLAPDPPSVPPPAPPVPPAAPVPVIEVARTPSPPPPAPELEPIEFAPAVTPAPLPVSTPVALEIAVTRAPDPLPIVSVSSRSRRRRPIYVAVFVVWGLAAIVLTAAAVVTLREKKTHAASAATVTVTHAPTPTTTSTPTLTPTASETVAVTASASASATVTAATATATATASTTDTHGTINLPSSAAGHRVFVDGRVASDGAKPIDVACGHHSVRVGSHGKAQSIDVPCGGAIDLEP
jgi:serine/threonine-protein kinase